LGWLDLYFLGYSPLFLYGVEYGLKLLWISVVHSSKSYSWMYINP
jgi:hypothetical protein